MSLGLEGILEEWGMGPSFSQRLRLLMRTSVLRRARSVSPRSRACLCSGPHQRRVQYEQSFEGTGQGRQEGRELLLHPRFGRLEKTRGRAA